MTSGSFLCGKLSLNRQVTKRGLTMESFTIRSLRPNDEDAFNEFRRDVFKFRSANIHSQNIVRELTPATDFDKVGSTNRRSESRKPELSAAVCFFSCLTRKTSSWGGFAAGLK